MMDLDVPVLRHETLGNVHVRHDFDARNEGGVKLFGRRRFFLQQSVNPVAQLQRVLERHEMDVAGALAHRRGNNDIDQVHDRRLIGHDLDIVQGFALAVAGPLTAEVFDHPLDRDLVTAGDGFRDFRRREFLRNHFQSRQQTDVVNHAGIAGFGGGEAQDTVLNFQGQDPVTLDEICRQGAKRIRPWRQVWMSRPAIRKAVPTPEFLAQNLYSRFAGFASNF